MKKFIKESTSKWDSQSARYNSETETISSDVADNLLIAWPALIDEIKPLLKKKKPPRVLDYGCGTGGLALRIAELEVSVDGIDTSEGMISCAEKMNSKNAVQFIKGDFNNLSGDRYDAIVSCMVLQFVSDIENVASDLYRLLNKNGIFAFTVFNPYYMDLNTGANKSFILDQNSLYFSLDDEFIPVFYRTKDDYMEIFQKAGFRSCSCITLPFTEQYIKEFWDPQSGIDVSEPEFLLMSFVKS